jgi:hypothetical protein
MRAKKSVLKKLRQISLAELAVLEMTNDPKVKSKARGKTVTVTSKEAYVWAALMAHVAEKAPQIGADEVVRAALAAPPHAIKNYYRAFPLGAIEMVAPTANWGMTPDVLGLTIKKLGLQTTTKDVVHSASSSYYSLTKKGLIEDPVEILVGATVIAVLGLLPVGFTRKTKEGRTISKKLKALYWSYETSESRGVTTTKVEFRLLKMIKAFRAGMVGGFKNALDADEDEDAN